MSDAKKAFFNDPSKRPVIDQPDHRTIFEVFPAHKRCYVLWKLEWSFKGKKWDKIPYQINGCKAASTKPWQWESLWQMRLDLTRSRYLNYDGLGVVFSKENRLIGVDLDNAIDPASGKLKPWATAIVALLGSYTELSPSRTGVKIFLSGALPEGYSSSKFHLEDGDVEIYDCGRYFTITGWHVADTPRKIEESTGLEKFCLDYCKVKIRTPRRASKTSYRCPLPLNFGNDLLDKARRCKNGPKFRDLYDLGSFAGYASQSEADLALCTILSYWFDKDPDAVDQAFRASALYRDKWERSDYRENTLAKACAAVTESHSEFLERRDREAEEFMKQFQEIVNKERVLTDIARNVAYQCSDPCHLDPRERCTCTFRHLFQNLRTGQLVRFRLRGNVCEGCMIRRRRLKCEDAEHLIDVTDHEYGKRRQEPVYYARKDPNIKVWAAKKRAMKRKVLAAARDPSNPNPMPAGGHISFPPDGTVLSLNTVELPGSKRLTSAEARAHLRVMYAGTRPRGKGKAIGTNWGFWRFPKPKKEREYRRAGPVYKLDFQLKEICTKYDGYFTEVVRHDHTVLDEIRFKLPKGTDFQAVIGEMTAPVSYSFPPNKEVDEWGPFQALFDHLDATYQPQHL